MQPYQNINEIIFICLLLLLVVLLLLFLLIIIIFIIIIINCFCFYFIRGDHTIACCSIFVLPPHTEAVVFSIDGALTSNFSLSGRDMKLRNGVLEVAR